MRRTFLASLLCARLLWPAAAHGEDEPKKACATAFTAAQRLRHSGSLLEARQTLAVCGGPQCPAVMQTDCQRWLVEVETSIPTVVFQVFPETPLLPQDVRLSLDGGDPSALDGRAVSLDPGSHSITVTAKGFRPMSKSFVVTEGEKLRREVISLEPLPPPPRMKIAAKPEPLPPAASPEKSGTFTWPVVTALSVTALAGIGAVYFGVNARKDDRALSDCFSSCPQTRVDHVRNQYLWTNISIGVAAAGLATAVVLWLVHRYSTPSSASSSRLEVKWGTF